MSNYTKTTNFATKDNLSPGNPLKIVKGTEIDTEYNNIATAVATKTDNSAAAITGGTITGITDLAVADGGTGASTAAGGLNNLLPSQTSNANKYLQTDGTNASWDAVSLSTADITGTLGVANGGTGVTTSTGTTNVVLSNSPTLVTPILGTPTSATLTNATGLPISTGVSGLGTGVATLLATPSSANLASAITDETGSGALVFATSPTLVTPILGTPTSGTLTNATGLPISTGVSGLGTGVATFLATPSSANLLSALTDETGTGSAVFATSPTLVTPLLGTPTSGVATNLTGLPLTTGVTGLLPVANGGTATATPSIVAGSNITVTGTWPNQTIAASGGGSPGGSTTQVQYNNAGAFAGITGATTNGTALTLVAPVLGTPASGVVTNLTGTASININGTVGATTATTGAFTSVTASTTLGVTGVSTFSAGTAALPAITTTGDTNTGVFFPAADSVATTVGGAEGTRLTSTGFGVGTTTPDVLSRGYGTHLSVSNTSSAGAAIQINGGSVGYPALELGRNGVRKVLITAQSTVTEFGNLEAVPLIIKTNDVERARFNTTGAFVFNGGTTTADGIGITFPATQSASTNANTLDDYEEGTWTPTQGSGLTLVGAFSSSGRYVKIGKTVMLIGSVAGATTVALSSNGELCGGLPFTAAVEPYPLALLNCANTKSGAGLSTGTNITECSAMTASPNIKFTITYFV